ncbi:MAG: alpha/beta hydrolase [Chloroflexota bacterium]
MMRGILAEGELARAGYQLRYWLAGPAGAPLLVFTHGAAMDHRMFTAQIPAVTRQYRLLLWDVRGHGQSGPLNGDFSIRAAVEDLVTLLDEVGSERAILVGHSMGGYISQELLFLHPERVAALVTVGSTCLTLEHPWPVWVGMQLSPLALSLYPYRAFVWQAAWGITISRAVRAYVKEVVGRHSKQEFIDIWAAIMDCIHPEPGYRITQPLLVTHGRFDYLGLGVMQQQARAWAGRDPNCKYVVIPGAAHNAKQENPAFFNKILLDFLQELPLKAPTHQRYRQIW